MTQQMIQSVKDVNNMNFVLKYPLKNIYVNQGFGENRVPFYKELGMLGHNGIDFAAPDSTPVYASHDGIITFTGEDGSGGLGVVIRTLQEFDYNGEQVYFKTVYWHLKTNTFKVKPGDIVKAGDLIALADNTGMSTHSHLHFGLKPVKKGEADWSWFNSEQNNGYNGSIDPAPFFKFQFETNLYMGRRNGDVKKWQEFLISKGFTIKDGATGYFGEQTRQATIKFQKANNITPAYGFVGSVTRSIANQMV